MKVARFSQWSSSTPSACTSCGGEVWDDADKCDDCKDSDLEPEAKAQPEPSPRLPRLPRFGVPTTKSQNIYYL